jgi:hypothetical protein
MKKAASAAFFYVVSKNGYAPSVNARIVGKFRQ